MARINMLAECPRCSHTHEFSVEADNSEQPPVGTPTHVIGRLASAELIKTGALVCPTFPNDRYEPQHR